MKYSKEGVDEWIVLIERAGASNVWDCELKEGKVILGKKRTQNPILINMSEDPIVSIVNLFEIAF